MSGQLLVHKTEKLNLASEIRMELPILLTPGGLKTYSLSSMLEMSLIECWSEQYKHVLYVNLESYYAFDAFNWESPIDHSEEDKWRSLLFRIVTNS